jgi:hypothetical protein
MALDPITGVVTVAKAAESSEADQIAPKLLLRVLGPTADEIGEALRRWTSYRVGNVKRITEKADAKAQKHGRDGIVNPRVAFTLLEEGSLCDGELMADYLGGVLAGSRTPTGGDDRAVTWSGAITRLSALQIRAHFLLYREWAVRLHGKQLLLNENQSNATMYGDLDEFCALLIDGSGIDDGAAALFHSLTGLAASGFIDKLSWGARERLGIRYASDGTPECPYEQALRVVPTPVGVELYGWAIGFPGLNLSDFSEKACLFQPDVAIPRLEKVAIPRIPAPTGNQQHLEHPTT